MRGANLAGASLCDAILCETDLSFANLDEADLSGANMSCAALVKTSAYESRLSGAVLRKANLREVNFNMSDLSHTDLTDAVLVEARLQKAALIKANLTGANLERAILTHTNLEDANLSNCAVFGATVWDVNLDGAVQNQLNISPNGEHSLTVDNLEVAQFIYLLLSNERIRNVIDTITTKVVLVLGRFTPERKPILDEIHKELRQLDYCPIIFDFQKPASRDFIESVSVLAHMARFVVADFTSAKIVLEEVPHIVRNIAVPVIPLLQGQCRKEPVTLDNLRRNHRSVLPTHRYQGLSDLIPALRNEIISKAEARAKELSKLTD